MTPHEILVVRALALGDMLCSVPFLRALRARHPEARITLVGLPWAASFVARFDRYVDALCPFPGWPGIPEAPYEPERTERFVAASRRRPADLAVQAHGSGRDINGFLMALGATARAGFHPPDASPPTDGTWLPYPTGRHEVRRLLLLADAMGADATDDRLEWPVRPDDEAELARAVAPARLVPGAYAVVHPGASRPINRWPAARFAAVADRLAARGLAVVLTGSGAESAAAADVAARMSAPAVDLAGRT
ncbi:MAG TPA: glycosyltransferase family 9 protein, partial [Candidatus Limnocylindrales bacterium]